MAEFGFRYNHRGLLGYTDLQRSDAVLKGVGGKRLLYRDSIAARTHQQETQVGIDSRSIDTELTLELDEEEITVSEFSASFEHFLGLVKEVTKAIAPRRKPTWLVKIYPGSAGIGFYP